MRLQLPIQKIIKLIAKEISIKRLILVTCALLLSIFFLKWDYNAADYKTINSLLITASGIFSALVISILITGLSSLKNQRFLMKEKIQILSDKLTKFRRLLYYVTKSHNFWGETKFQSYALKLEKAYPEINANKHSTADEELKPIIEDSFFETNRTNLFLNMLTIVDIEKGDDLRFIQPSTKYKYTIDRLVYYHECFNNIWYYLNHKRASGLNDNTDAFSGIYSKEITETYGKLVNKSIEIKDFNSNLLVELGNEFYYEINPELLRLIDEITSQIPKSYGKLISNLILILFFGVIIPLLMISITACFVKIISLFCLSITIVLLVNLIFHIWDFTYKDSKIY